LEGFVFALGNAARRDGLGTNGDVVV